MPAKNSIRVNQKGIYSHIYNRGVENRVIFNDEDDYSAFLGFLKDYLTPPPHRESAKKTFTVNGRIFRGVPHQPKNYFNKVELLAYSLMPDHFHLLLHQKTAGSMQNFLRSLCTRYSMYFNKKYKRTGALFEGPYKSIQVTGISPLVHLSRYLHRESNNSSYAEYMGERSTSWVNSKSILAYFENSKNSSFKGVKGYKNFIEKFEPAKEDTKALEGIILERPVKNLERRVLTLEKSKPHKEINADIKSTLPSALELAVALGVFCFLFSFGIRNVIKAQNFESSTVAPTVSGVSTKETQEALKPVKTVIVKVEDKGAKVNIRKEPLIESLKVGTASDGDTFEFVNLSSDWYEIKLNNEDSGFISTQFAEVVPNN